MAMLPSCLLPRNIPHVRSVSMVYRNSPSSPISNSIGANTTWTTSFCDPPCRTANRRELTVVKVQWASSCAVRLRANQSRCGGRGVTRDFFYVGDLVKACLAAAGERVERGAYNIGGGTAITLGQLIDFVEELTNTKLSVVNAPPRNLDPRSILLDITKARRCLGWIPEVGIEAGIERTWVWFKSLLCSEVNAL